MMLNGNRTISNIPLLIFPPDNIPYQYRVVCGGLGFGVGLGSRKSKLLRSTNNITLLGHAVPVGTADPPPHPPPRPLAGNVPATNIPQDNIPRSISKLPYPYYKAYCFPLLFNIIYPWVLAPEICFWSPS